MLSITFRDRTGFSKDSYYRIMRPVWWIYRLRPTGTLSTHLTKNIYFFIPVCSHTCLSFVSAIQKFLFWLAIMVSTCDPSTWDVEAEGPRLATLPQKQTKNPYWKHPYYYLLVNFFIIEHHFKVYKGIHTVLNIRCGEVTFSPGSLFSNPLTSAFSFLHLSRQDSNLHWLASSLGGKVRIK